MFVAVSLFSHADFGCCRIVKTEMRFLKLINWLYQCRTGGDRGQLRCIVDQKGQDMLMGWATKYIAKDTESVTLHILEIPIFIECDDETVVKDEFWKCYENEWNETAIDGLPTILPNGYLDLLDMPKGIVGLVETFGMVPDDICLEDFHCVSLDDDGITELFELTPDYDTNNSFKNMAMMLCKQSYDLSDELQTQYYLLDVIAMIMFLWRLVAATGWSYSAPSETRYLEAFSIEPFILGLLADENDIEKEWDIQTQQELALNEIMHRRGLRVQNLLVDNFGGRGGTVFSLGQAIFGIKTGKKDERVDSVFDDMAIAEMWPWLP